MLKRRAILFLCAFVTLPLLACGGDGGTGPTGPESLVKVDGDQQSGIVAEPLATDPTVEVRDADGDPLSGVSVDFEVTSGAGSVSSATVTTDGQGRASTTWTLGTSVEATQSLEASSGSITATFTADPQAGPAATLEIVSGDEQQVSQADSPLPDPLVVEVSDAYGNPVGGATVEFSTDAGSVSPAQATTDASGRAQTTATVGSQSELGTALIGPSSLDRAREDLLYEEVLTALMGATFQATAPDLSGGSGSVEFTAGVDASTLTTTWSVSQSSPPSGITLGSEGSLNGVPSPNTAGDYTFTVEASDGGSSIASREYTLTVCEPPLQLAVGQSDVFNPPASGECGVFLPAGASGDRYRVGVLWSTSAMSTASSLVDLSVQRYDAPSTAPSAAVAEAPDRAPRLAVPGAVLPSSLLRSELRTLEATERAHRQIRDWEESLLSRLESESLLPSRDPARAPGVGPAAAAPASRDFYAPALSCSLDDTETVRANLVLETDHLIAYQDSAQAEETPVGADLFQRMSDYYAMYGEQVIEDYFGGISDIDGNGKLIVFVTEQPDELETPAAAFVLGRDLYEQAECPASNEAEMTYFQANVILAMEGDAPTYQALGTLVHEVKHISSLYNRIQEGNGAHDAWIEEGSADIAAEVSSRLAWADSGGPAVGETMNRADHFPSGTSFNSANWGVLLRMARLVLTLSSQPNGLTEDPAEADEGHTFYGSSWHFHRFVGDAYRGGMPDDSTFFRKQNRTTTPGVGFLESEFGGKSLETLQEELVLASLVNGTGAEGSVAQTFSGYDFSSSAEIFCVPNPLGVYPWTVTTFGSRSQGNCQDGYDPGAETQDPAADFATASYSGLIGAGGLRAHAFRSDGTGQGIEINVDVEAPADSGARVVVIRID